MRRRRSGQTLIEVLVVITLIAMIAAAVAISAVGVAKESRITTAKTGLKTLENALDACFGQTGRFPTTPEGFGPLLERRIVKEPPIDPWGTPYVYALVDGAPVVTSLGADGVAGGEGDGADLSTAQGVRRQ